MPLAPPPAIAVPAAPAVAPIDAALALQLESQLLRTTSATATLERWCADRALAAPPRVVAVVVSGVARPASAATRARLGVRPGERLGYRHVRLMCGGQTLSEADNWYVASRLPPAVNTALATSDAPFGKLVAPLGVTRRTLGIHRLWRAGMAPPPVLLRQRALVLDRDGRLLAEVTESYRAVLVAPLPAAD